MANKNGSIGLDVSSNQIRMIELDSSSKVLQSSVVDFEGSSFPVEAVNQLLVNAQQSNASIGLILPLTSAVTASAWVPKYFEDPNVFIQDALKRLLPDELSEYFISIDTQGPKSVSKGTLAIAVAVRHQELSKVRDEIFQLSTPPQLLDLPTVTCVNLLELFKLDLPESFVVLNIEMESCHFNLFKDGRFIYSEISDISSDTIDMVLQGFLERHFSQNAAEIKIISYGSGLTEFSNVGGSLENDVKSLSLDQLNSGVWDHSTKYSCISAYVLAMRGLES